MKLSAMTQQEKSRWICEKLEPLSELPNPEYCDYSDMEHFDAKCWIPSYAVSPITLLHVPEWQPRDMTEPAMTLMLIKELLRGLDYECVISQDEIEMSWRTSVNNTGHSFMVSLIKNTLEQAVAEAFMIANGFKEE